MSFLILGFFTGLSLILAIGAQNIFVIEQGLKKKHIFLVCIICSFSDLVLIFLGIFLFHYLNQYFTESLTLILNIFLLIFLIYFVLKKIIELKKINNISVELKNVEEKYRSIILKTLGFTYLNPHVYSDTVFFLGNFSKDFIFINKIYFGIGASISSFIFFFTLGYLSKLFSKHLTNRKAWISINIFIILFMISIIFYVLGSIF